MNIVFWQYSKVVAENGVFQDVAAAGVGTASDERTRPLSLYAYTGGKERWLLPRLGVACRLRWKPVA